MRCSIGRNLLIFLRTAILWDNFLHSSSTCTSKLKCFSIVAPKSLANHRRPCKRWYSRSHLTMSNLVQIGFCHTKLFRERSEKSFFSFFFLLRFSTRKHSPWPLVPFFQNFYEEQWSQSHPQYISGLSRALFPTTVFEIAVYLNNTWKCGFVLRNEGITNSSPFLNDTKICILLTILMD